MTFCLAMDGPCVTCSNPISQDRFHKQTVKQMERMSVLLTLMLQNRVFDRTIFFISGSLPMIESARLANFGTNPHTKH
jgi:ABC-type phosphate transport system ATPase subunit